MIGALWSATPQKVSEYPIVHLVDYMSRHGMMALFNRPDWKTISGGSNSYIKALQNKLKTRFLTSTGVAKVKRFDDHTQVLLENGESQQFDHVVFSCHSNQALRLIDEPTKAEQEILSTITFQANEVVIHTDESVMHPNPLSWASWNTTIPANAISQQPCTAVYWMNALQKLDCRSNVFVSLNPQTEIASDKILKTRNYQHPIFDQASVAAQKRLGEINGKNRCYFAGAYWGWGFHEDGARSGYDAASLLKQHSASTS
jgi:predicted NAD/FAD-binding protein